MESEWEEGGGVKGIRDVVCLWCVGGEGWRGKLILWWISGMVVWRRGEQSIWLYSWRRVQEGGVVEGFVGGGEGGVGGGLEGVKERVGGVEGGGRLERSERLYQVPIGFSTQHTTLAGRDELSLATCEPQARGW